MLIIMYNDSCYGDVIILFNILYFYLHLSIHLSIYPSIHPCFLRGTAWFVENFVRNNDAHPWIECSNRGICDRDTG